MNGCLLFERMDGTKNEIAKELREQNIFIFGERVEGMNWIKKESHKRKRNISEENYWKYSIQSCLDSSETLIISFIRNIRYKRSNSSIFRQKNCGGENWISKIPKELRDMWGPLKEGLPEINSFKLNFFL